MTEIRAKIRHILDAEASAIAAVEVTDAYERALEALLGCKGKVVTTGIGKAGFIAKRPPGLE